MVDEKRDAIRAALKMCESGGDHTAVWRDHIKPRQLDFARFDVWFNAIREAPPGIISMMLEHMDETAERCFFLCDPDHVSHAEFLAAAADLDSAAAGGDCLPE